MAELSPDLRRAMKALRLGKLLPILPERLRTAREHNLDPEDLLLQLFTDETSRRANLRHERRAKLAGLQPDLVFELWDPSTDATFDVGLLDELRTLRFIEPGANIQIIGPVGVGKTMLSHALGHLAIQRELKVHCQTADKLLHQLRASRLDDTYATELRRLCDVDLLILDDLALRAMTATETTDLYEIVTARHRRQSIIVTSNRDPSEWLGQFADQLHAQALVDRFTNNAYELVIEGPSFRQRQKPRRSSRPS